MTQDRRGFHYELEPMRSMSAWEVNDIAGECAQLNAAVDKQHAHVTNMSTTLAEARDTVLQQRSKHVLFNIDGQRLAHAYMVQLQQLLQAEKGRLVQMEEERDTGLARLNRARKFADSLDRNKEAALAEYDETVRRKGFQQNDDNWLQRLHWKKSP